MPTPLQIRLLHIARKQVGLDDAQYRTVLRNAGKLKGDEPSSTDLSQTGFENVMAVLEEQGYRDPNRSGTYWRDKVEHRGRFASLPQAKMLRDLAQGSRYPLDAMCRQYSNGRTDQPEKLTPSEAWNLIEMYKGSNARAAAAAEKIARQPALFAGADTTTTGLPDAPAATRPRPARSAEDLRQQRAQYDDLPPDDDVPF